MNIDDLREQLEQLAGPVSRSTATARSAVAARVQRGRRRRSIVTATTSALAAALVVASVAVGLSGSNRSVNVRTTTPPATTPPQCTLGVATVPAPRVPSAVAAWAQGAAVVGGDELWTTRSTITSGPVHDRDVYRLKIGLYTSPFGIPAITARRLDAIEPPATGDANEAIDERGRWVASTIELPTPGCWEITARYKSSKIVFRRLIGNPPRPLAIGTITGVLEEQGMRALPIVGTIRIDGTTTALNDFGVSVETDARGRFRVDVPAGIHDISATSPQFQRGRFPCTAGSNIVRSGQTIRVVVACPIR